MISAYLRLECTVERTERQTLIVDRGKRNLQCLERISELNSQACSRFKIFRVKQIFECERLNESIDCAHRRLLCVLDARVRALKAPEGALDSLHFQILCRHSEECKYKLIYVTVYTCIRVCGL